MQGERRYRAEERPGELRILYVEDDPDLRELTTEFLERQNDRFDVVSEPDATDGLARLEEEVVDCIISDYDMPQMDGLEFLRTVRKTRPDLPFILFTGKGSEEVASEAIAADVTHYLQKRSGPEQYELLANRIEKAVSQYYAERRAGELKRRYEALFDQVDDPIAWIEFEGDIPVIRDVNPAFADVFSPPEDGFLGVDLDEVVAPDSRIEAARRLSHRVRDGQPVHEEVIRETADGPRTFEVKVIPVSDPDGDAVTDAFGVYTDVTERKERERELESINQRLETVVSNVPVILFAFDDTGVFTLSEGKGLAALGFEPDEVVGKSVEEVFGWHDRIPDDVERALAGERVNVVREVEGRIYDTTHQPVFDDDGTVAAVIGVGMDITERRERERELEQARKRMEFALDAIDAVVWTWNVDADETTFYPSAESLYGTSVDTLEEFIDLIHPEDQRAVRDAIERTLATGEQKHEEVRILRDDEVRWIETLGQVVDDDGPTRLVGVARDVTDRKRTERKLERRGEQSDRRR